MKTDTHENLAAGGRWEGGASAETWLKCLLCSGWIGVEISRSVLERVIRITPRRLSQHFKLNTHHNPHLIAITYHISHINEYIKIFLPICKTVDWPNAEIYLQYFYGWHFGSKSIIHHLFICVLCLHHFAIYVSKRQNQSAESLSLLQLIKSWVWCVFCLFPIFPARLYNVQMQYDRVLVEEVDTVQAQQVLTSGTLSFSLFHRQCF